MRLVRIATLIAAVAMAMPAFAAPPTTAPTAMYVEVYKKGERRDEKIAGKLGAQDDVHVLIDTTAGPRDLKWDELTPSSAFTLKARLVDPTSAPGWLSVGRWGWEHGLELQAKTAFARATKLDQGVAKLVASILAKPAGPVVASATPGPTSKPTLAPAANGASSATPPELLQPSGLLHGKLVRYQPSTPEEDAASVALSRKRKDEAQAELKVNLAEVESPHFLIYTDWAPGDYGFLKDQCEGAYRVVCKQFDRSPKDNVFVGKLPIYMFAKQATFRKFAETVDEVTLPETVLGYFVPVDEMGHMAMWKPGIGSGSSAGIGAGATLADAQRNWGRTLVHEFSHAFIHRYKSNARIPRWLNEGTAEVISESVLPTSNYYYWAREAAQQDVDLLPLFSDRNMPTGQMYPVMMTLVEFMVRRDRTKFLAMFNDMKDGTAAEDALKKAFNVDDAGLVKAWHAYALKL